MESPLTSKLRLSEGENLLPRVNCTPKNRKTVAVAREEFGLYHLHRESSPNFRAGQDVLEVGWGDSPGEYLERINKGKKPLNIEQKIELDRTPVTCKKKLEPKESPRSSLPFKRRNVRSTFNSQSNVDVEKYVAEVQELSKNIMKEFNAQESDSRENNGLSSPARLSECSVKSCNVKIPQNVTQDVKILELNCDTSEGQKDKDSTLDSVIQSFINEEDDWLCQALSTQEVGKVHKGNFVKSKSENELSLTQSVDLEKKSLTQNCRNINNNLKRTSSCDMSKPQNSKLLPKCGLVNNFSETKRNFISEKSEMGPSTQYSLQEIERKRLEAKYRRERREIERKKFEALKKLEMKKLRVIRT